MPARPQRPELCAANVEDLGEPTAEGLSVSDYVRSRTVEDARRDLAGRRRIRIGPEHAEAFYAALDDSTPVPALQRLAGLPHPDLS